MAYPSITRHLQRVSETHPDDRVRQWAKDSLTRLEQIQTGALLADNLFDTIMKDLILESFTTGKAEYTFAEPGFPWHVILHPSDYKFDYDEAVDDWATDQYDKFIPILRHGLKLWAEAKKVIAENVENGGANG